MADYKTLSAWLRNGSSKDAAVNGSVTPVDFEYVVAAGDTVDVDHMTVLIEEATGNFRPDYYTTSGALGTGLLVRVLNADDSVWIDLLEGDTVVKQGDWLSVGAVPEGISYAAGPETAAYRWAFNAGGGKGLRLEAGQKLQVKVQDDLTALAIHEFHIIGEVT